MRYLTDGEIVGIFPEATISRSFEIKEIKSGAVRIAAEAGVPLIPVILWGTQRLMTKDHPRDFSRGKTIAIHVGEPMHPTGETLSRRPRELRDAMAALLADHDRGLPDAEQPPGSWWLPAATAGLRRPRARRPARRRGAAGAGRASGPPRGKAIRHFVDILIYWSTRRIRSSVVASIARL